MVISESGVSRQIEFTPLRKRLALGVVFAVIAALVAAFFAFRSVPAVDKSVLAERDALAGKLRTLEEKLQKQELELTVRENRLQEMEQSLARAVTEAPASRDVGTPPLRQRAESRSAREGPLTSLPESDATAQTGPARAERSDDAAERPPAARERARHAEPAPPQAAPTEEDRGGAPVSVSSMAFDAQEMTAVAEGPNKGKLSFRLVKDHPKVRFSGYLFVFVEMVDKRGESKIYAYPKRTRLGEGDLPQDFRSGESLAFKFNSRVELPYTDTRANASLSQVTIVLYGEDGSIVFQRGFDRSKLKIVSAHATKAEGVQPPQPAKKRQAL